MIKAYSRTHDQCRRIIALSCSPAIRSYRSYDWSIADNTRGAVLDAGARQVVPVMLYACGVLHAETFDIVGLGNSEGLI
jgi:hypothetical protein